MRAQRTPQWIATARWFFWLAIVLIAVPRVPAESMRLRIAWGGGEQVAWRGRITLNEGRFSAAQCLGGEPDAAASYHVEASYIQVAAPRPLSYQALDVSVDAPLTAKLEIKISGETIREGPRLLSVNLQDLVSDSFNHPLDAAGNRILIRRSPGDQLRVTTAIDHLVFSPGDRWDLTVQPHLLDVPTASRVTIRMLAARSHQVIWRKELELDGSEDHPFTTAAIPIPNDEGVYDLIISHGGARNLGLFRQAASEVERRIQFIVLSPDSPTHVQGPGNWREAVSFDAAEPQWWERLSRFPNWQRLAITPRRLQGKGTAEVTEREGSKISRLAPGGWQTYPLPIVSVGAPHILEVAYPGDQTQSLGVSIVEAGPDGPSSLQSLDHAIHVQSPNWSSDGKTCRVVFWPSTRMPHVLLTNLDEANEAVFGRIRLLEGPKSLPTTAAKRIDHGYRIALAQFDEPAFHKAFFPSHGIDSDSGRALTDWKTFYQGGQRLVEYLNHAGFGGVTLTCIGEGGAICPVPVMDATPRFDSGPFFELGQDVFRKDVVEMLLRMFDRERLRFVLGIRLTTSLPELERQLRDPRAAEGISLVDSAGNTFRVAGAPPRYNPLDPRVQQVVVRLVRDLVLRYGRHPSFSGVSIDMSPGTFLLLPGVEWGCDAQTLSAFHRDMGKEIPDLKLPIEVEEITNGRLRPAWIQWRSQQISDLFATISRELKSTRPDAELFMSMNRLPESGMMRLATRPSLPRPTSVAAALAAMGIHGQKLSQQGIVLPKPETQQPLFRPTDRGSLEEFSTDQSWSEVLASGRSVGQIYQPPFQFRSAGFDEGKVFTGETTDTRLEFQVVNDGQISLQGLAHALANDDSLSLSVGGRRTPLIQSQAVSRWLDIYQRLPARVFSTAELANSKPHPVVLRYLSHAGKTYLYAVNDSPWPVKVISTLAAAASCQVSDIDGAHEGEEDRKVSEFTMTETGLQWHQSLAPFELSACVLTDPKVVPQSISVTLPTTVAAELQGMLANVGGRLAAIKQPTASARLSNAGFDHESTSLPSWESSRESNVTVQRDVEVKFSGPASLRMESQRPIAWVRSDPISIPATGRLSLQAMVRGETSGPLPPLRIAVEGVLNGQPYYRFAQVALTGNDQTRALQGELVPSNEWSPFMLHVSDLPTTGLSELRVRFDLMGAGVAWIDDVRLFDLALTQDEQLQLAKIVGLADFQLRDGRLADCERTLRSYWPQYLLRNVAAPEPRMANLPQPVIDPVPPKPRSQTPEPSLFDKMREFIPQF